jgi:hypothetical protein
MNENSFSRDAARTQITIPRASERENSAGPSGQSHK